VLLVIPARAARLARKAGKAHRPQNCFAGCVACFEQLAATSADTASMRNAARSLGSVLIDVAGDGDIWESLSNRAVHLVGLERP
jgi:hypothetical protein